MADRKDCPMRHENGNCLPCGGFCTAVNDSVCEALHNAYRSGADDRTSRILNGVTEIARKQRYGNEV